MKRGGDGNEEGDGAPDGARDGARGMGGNILGVYIYIKSKRSKIRVNKTICLFWLEISFFLMLVFSNNSLRSPKKRL
jgi:hypothetical protein